MTPLVEKIRAIETLRTRCVDEFGVLPGLRESKEFVEHLQAVEAAAEAAQAGFVKDLDCLCCKYTASRVFNYLRDNWGMR